MTYKIVRNLCLFFHLFMAETIVFASGGNNAEKDINTFTASIQASINNEDSSLLDKSMDLSAMVNKAVAGYEASENLKNAYLKGIKKEFDKESYGERLLAMMGESGSYKFLRLNKTNGNYRAIFRMIDKDGGVNYHEMHLLPVKSGEITITDIYIISNGELMSDTFRRGFLPLIHEEKKGIVGKLFGWEHDFIKNLPKIQRMQALDKKGNAKEALKIYMELPPSLQKDKLFLILRLQYASRSDDFKEYEDAIQAYKKAFPDDPALDLIMIDSHAMNKKYGEAIQSVNRLEKSVGGDPYLNVMRANIYYVEGEFKLAKEYAEKAIKEEPTLGDGYWTLVTISLEEKNYKETGRLLSLIEKNLGIELSDLQDAPLYEGFIKSTEYRTWMKLRKR